MTDPATLDEYNERYMQNHEITGFGMDVVNRFPCPGCAAPGWLDFPITAALNDYAGVQHPTTCENCGRTFQLVVTLSPGATEMTLIQRGGDPVPSYLPPLRYEP